MLANQTPNAVQPFQGGLSGEIGSDSDGIKSFLTGGEGKFSGWLDSLFCTKTSVAKFGARFKVQDQKLQIFK